MDIEVRILDCMLVSEIWQPDASRMSKELTIGLPASGQEFHES